MRKSDSSSLRENLDTVAALRGLLLSLGTEQNAFEAILSQLVLQKVDSFSKHAYNRGQNYEQFPTWDNFYNILGRYCQFLECWAKPGGSSEKLNHPHKKAFLTARRSCIKCDSTDHNLGSCPSFVPHGSGMLGSKRQRYVQTVFIRATSQLTVLRNFAVGLVAGCTIRCSTQVVACLPRKSNRALIATAIVLIQDKYGMFHPARALLDSGSEINFITETLANKLQLQGKRQHFEVSGIGDVTAKLSLDDHTLTFVCLRMVIAICYYQEYSIDSTRHSYRIINVVSP